MRKIITFLFLSFGLLCLNGCSATMPIIADMSPTSLRFEAGTENDWPHSQNVTIASNDYVHITFDPESAFDWCRVLPPHIHEPGVYGSSLQFGYRDYTVSCLPNTSTEERHCTVIFSVGNSSRNLEVYQDGAAE